MGVRSGILQNRQALKPAGFFVRIVRQKVSRRAKRVFKRMIRMYNMILEMKL